MLLAKELVDYVARQIVTRLSPSYVEVSDPNIAFETVQHIVLDELEIEDKLNDEVREILSQYGEYMRTNGVSYQEMFRKIKNTLITQKKIVRASGRDTGDGMKLSRDKITDISHKIVTQMKKSRDFRVKKEQNEVRLEIVRAFTDFLTAEDKVDRAARTKIKTHGREITDGSDEYSILHKRYYAEEMRKLGIDLS
jgi:uncharacterized protein